jgi:chromosome segregation ATPase
MPSLRPLSRPSSRGSAQAGSSAAAPGFWAHQSASKLLDASIRSPELKLQLLTRAVEESRAKTIQLQQDRFSAAETLRQLCEEAGAPTGALAAPSGPEDDDALPRCIDLLSAQLRNLRQQAAQQEAATVQAQAQYHQAAGQVVAAQAERDELQRRLEESRCAVAQRERAAAELQARVGQLGEQLEAAAGAARQKLEVQLAKCCAEAQTAE